MIDVNPVISNPAIPAIPATVTPSETPPVTARLALYHDPTKVGEPIVADSTEIVIALNAAGADVGFIEIASDKGHDSFLLDVPDFLNALKNFVDNSYKK